MSNTAIASCDKAGGPLLEVRRGMRESVRLGTIAGVRVGLNVSVFVILAILVFGLAAGGFPRHTRARARWHTSPRPWSRL